MLTNLGMSIASGKTLLRHVAPTKFFLIDLTLHLGNLNSSNNDFLVDHNGPT